MNPFVYLANWTKVRALPRILISLCMLIVSFVFVPQLSQFTRSVSVPISIYIYLDCQNYVPLSIFFTVSDNLHRAKRGEGDTYRRAQSIADVVVSCQTFRHFISNLWGISNCLSSFDGIFKKGFQEICQLLDIPPPSDMVPLEIRGRSILNQI